MRLGLIGAGRHGSRYLQALNGGEKISRVLTRSGNVDTPPWCQSTTDINDFFAGGLDGVVIATPPESHAHLAVRAFRMGCHVLIEKPLALSLDECKLIIACAEEADRRLLVAHTYLFDTNFEALLPHISNPQSIHCLFGGPSPQRTYSTLLDWGPHVIAIAAALRGYQLPQPQHLEAHFGDTWTTLQIGPDRLRISSTTDTPRRLLEVNGSHLYFDFRESKPSKSPIARQLEVFEDLINGGSDPRASLAFAHDICSMLFSFPTQEAYGRSSS